MTTLSRRSFIASAAMAVGGWWALPALGAPKTKADPNRFVLMADTHVCGDRTAMQHECNPDEMFPKAVQAILQLSPSPSGVLIAGDCVYLHGEKADYEVLQEFLLPLREAGIPVYLALGNHDNREALEAVIPDAVILRQSVLPQRKTAVIPTPAADWYLLDSLEKTNYTPGRFGEEQLSWLAGELDKNPSKPALLIAHHYPKKKADDDSLEDTEAFLKVIAPRKQVKAYIFGHSHAWSLRKGDEGIHFVNLPANAWLFDEKCPRGFVEACLNEKGAELTLHCLNPTDKRHLQGHRLDWRQVK